MSCMSWVEEGGLILCVLTWCVTIPHTAFSAFTTYVSCVPILYSGVGVPSTPHHSPCALPIVCALVVCPLWPFNVYL